MTVPAPIDTYDKLYTYCDNIGNPTTFIDACPVPKTITANGNATQLPIKFNKSAGFFNGTTDYVDIPNSTDFNFGTGDYCVQFFLNINTTGDIGNHNLVDLGNGYSSNGLHIHLDQASSTNVNFRVYERGMLDKNDVWVPTKRQWYFIQVMRVSGVTDVYIDGVKLGSSYTGTVRDIQTGSTGNMVGYAPANSYYLNGWMKELRISNASRATTVPTTQYTSDANTVLLMHFDTPATSPLAPAIAFDGTGDYLSVDDHADWDFGTGAFTVEMWINPANVTGNKVVLSRNNDVYMQMYLAANAIMFCGITQTGTSLVANKWIHIAGVREGNGANQTKIYADGKLVGTGTFATNISGTQKVTIGVYSEGLNIPYNGFMREIRISNVARYTTAFTPTQTGYPASELANTVLYIKGDENNGVTTFVDSETSPKTVTTAGNTVIKYTEDYRSCIFKDETGKFPYPQGSAKVDFFAIGSGVGYLKQAEVHIAKFHQVLILI